MDHASFALPARARRSLRAASSTLLSFAALAGLAAAQTAGGQTAASPRHLRDVLAGDALVYVEAPDFQATMQRGKEIPIARILHEEEFQQFLGPLCKQIHAEIDTQLKAIGENPEAWKSCPLKSFEVGIGGLEPGDPPGLFVHIETANVGKSIRRLLAMPEFRGRAKFTEEDGVTLVQPGPPNGIVGIEGDAIVVSLIPSYAKGTATDAVKRVLKGLKTSDAKNRLAADAQFGSMLAKLQTKSPEWVIFARPAAIFDAVEKSAKDQMATVASRPGRRGEDPVAMLAGVRRMLDDFGILGIQGIAIAQSYSPGAVTSESFTVLSGDPKGAAAFLFGRKPIDPKLIEKAYDGVDSFGIRSVEPKILYDATLNAVTAIGAMAGGNQLPLLKQLAAFEKEHDIKIGEDLLGSIGPEAFTYSYPPKAGGGFAFPDGFMSFRVRDKAKFEKALKTLFDASQGSKYVKAEMSEPTANRPTVYTFKPNAEGMGQQMGMALAQFGGLGIAVTDEWALFSTNPVALKNELRKLGKPRDVAADVKKAFGQVPAGATEFSYHDWKPLVRSLWDGVASLASLVGGSSDEIPVNLQEIPTSQSITKHLTPSISYSTFGKDGIYSRSTGSFGFETIGGLAIGAGALAYWRTAMGAPMEIDEEELTAPASASAGGADKTAAARATLKSVDVAIRVYRAENGKYPGTLEALLTPNDDHPQGYIAGAKAVPKDPWGTALFYAVAADGASFQLRSFGPNAKDDGGGGDDIR